LEVQRTSAFIGCLEKYTLLQLIGPTGVGKTAFMRTVSDHYVLYQGLASLRKWAEDNTPNKVKILFFDESNLENIHYTQFAFLGKKENGYCLLEGKLYQLDGTHKVVFARNPASYGGDRVEDQKLFKMQCVPELHFSQLSLVVQYQMIKAQHGLCGFFSEEEFQNYFHQHCCARYSDASSYPTLRELEERLLEGTRSAFCDRKELLPKKSKRFVVLDSQKRACRQLLAKLRTRTQPGGKQALLLQGPPGSGKSEMVYYVLEDVMGYELGDLKASNTQVYCKISAHLSLEAITMCLQEALQGGFIVVIEEINTLPAGTEKVLNSTLSGWDPVTGEPAAVRGFCLVGTANGIDLAGRKALSPALSDRMERIEYVPPPDNGQKDLETFIKFYAPELLPEQITSVAFNFLKLTESQEKPFCHLNFRDLRAYLTYSQPNTMKELFIDEPMHSSTPSVSNAPLFFPHVQRTRPISPPVAEDSDSLIQLSR